MNKINVYIDIVFCVILLPLMIIAFPVERWWATAPLYFSLFVAWLYATYFLFRHYVVPTFFRNPRRRSAAIACIVASLAITAAFSMHHITSPYYHLRQQHAANYKVSVPVWGARPNQQAVWLHFIVVVTFSFALSVMNEAFRQRLARERIELERRKAELALYKAQVNPHFLFNTLNTLYGLLITGSDKTTTMLEQFISLTKYTYMNANSDFIAIGEEIKYINQYINLQLLRFGHNVEVEFTHNIANPRLHIPPMLLITFIENAFKYGVSSQEPSTITLRLEQSQNGNLLFLARNQVMRSQSPQSTGMGIANCIKRLELLYPGRHCLSYGLRDGNTYEVSLTILSEEAKPL